VNLGSEKEIIINLYNYRLKNPTKNLISAAIKLDFSTTKSLTIKNKRKKP